MRTPLPYIPVFSEAPEPPVPPDWERLAVGMREYYARRDALELAAQTELETRTRRRKRNGKATR